MTKRFEKSHTFTKDYISGKFILRIWDRDGKTLHNSIHDTSKGAYAELKAIQSKHQELRNLEAIERKAWKVKMNGSVEDGYTVNGKEGKNELAWRKAADDCRAYREKHGLVGLSWKEIEDLL